LKKVQKAAQQNLRTEGSKKIQKELVKNAERRKPGKNRRKRKIAHRRGNH
jgi:hypothetical protein